MSPDLQLFIQSRSPRPHGNYPPMPTFTTTTHLPVTISLTLYPLLHHLLAGPCPTLHQYTAALKATSTLHSLLTTTLSLYCIHNLRKQWLSPPSPTDIHNNPDSNSQKSRYPNSTTNPTITTRSPLANALTAFEAGYLLQDTIYILLKPHLYRRPTRDNPPTHLKPHQTTYDIPLLIHHSLLTPLLLHLHNSYILRSRELGIYIILQLLLMNASTPLLNLRWYLRTHHPRLKTPRLVADIAFAIAFFAARIALVGWVLRDHSKWHGMGLWEVFWRGLRVPCQLGTGALWVGNLGWWGVLIGRLVGRMRGGRGGGGEGGKGG